MNGFNRCLEQSHAASDLPFWKECYQKAFPDFKAMIDHRQDGIQQRMGIDRSIIFNTGKIIYIDEKVRGKNKTTGVVYEDIAIEEYSSIEGKILGWAEKELWCDYIAYAIAPLGKCYLLPVIQLQAAWKKNKDEWKAAKDKYGRPLYKEINAPNRSYTTKSWGIPVNVLFPAIGDMLRLDFIPIPEFAETPHA